VEAPSTGEPPRGCLFQHPDNGPDPDLIAGPALFEGVDVHARRDQPLFAGRRVTHRDIDAPRLERLADDDQIVRPPGRPCPDALLALARL